MKILVINGSPKGEKSNTLIVTNAFLEGIKQSQGSDIQIRSLNCSKLKIKNCLGCYNCWRNKEGNCCINDDMSDVIQAQLWADIIIWSFPLYYFSVPGALKTLIDRQLPMNLPYINNDDSLGSGRHPSRYDMKNKKHIIISTCGFYSTKGNYDGIKAMFNHMLGINCYETVFCAQGEMLSIPGVKENTKDYLKNIVLAGYEYCKGGISQRTRAKFSDQFIPTDKFIQLCNSYWEEVLG